MELKNKKILVTGSDGFIGSHLVERLVREGCQVRAFVYYNSFSSWGWLDTVDQDIKEKLDVVSGDIRDPNAVREAFNDINVAFHLAALIGIPYSYHAPSSYVETNIKGTLNVLQAAKDCSVEKILITSTSEVYGTAKYVPIDEEHPRQGQSPYSATKIGADYLTESFHRSFNSPVAIVRPFNTFGPRQSARAVIPTIITQLLSGEKKIELGELQSTRDFVYVKDTAEAFIEIAKSDQTIGEVINIASQQEVSVEELAKNLIQLIQPDASISVDMSRLRPKNSEVMRLLGSNEKIKKLTNWDLNYTFESALKETINWYSCKENLQLFKHDRYNV